MAVRKKKKKVKKKPAESFRKKTLKASPKKKTAKKKASAKKAVSSPERSAVHKKTTAKKDGRKAETMKRSFPRKNNENPLFVVGIGVSGGGLEAMEEFLSHMPADSGIAFVLVPHLDPTHSSIMADLLKKYTHLEVYQADDGMRVMPDCLYVIPPGKDMAIMNGLLQLLEPHMVRGMRHPIDFFFRSLAKDQKERAACIVMSGAGTDGTLGLKDIKGEGGMVMVQDPGSAKYDGMPRSAVDTGLADFVIPPERMPDQLISYVRHPYIVAAEERDTLMRKISERLDKVILLIRNQTGHDFSYYKENTIIRRIERRMNVNQITEVPDYVHHLQRNPVEVELLFKELLIGVTNFFRDAEAFEVIKKKVFPQIFRDRPKSQPVRAWVPGCSTGEEAYSLAMVLSEYIEKTGQQFTVQIFATDIDSGAIDKARAGIYPESIVGDVSQERLKRFFMKGDNIYQVKKGIREMVIFAAQDMIKDPPFTRLDFVSCRNLLIYLNPKIQKKLLPLFQFVLNPKGYLFLGSSETIGEAIDLFSAVDKKWKIYRCKGVRRVRPEHLDFPALRHRVRDVTELQGTGPAVRGEMPPVGEVAMRMLMEDYAPPCAVINEKHNILYIHGKTGKYLEPAPGEARLNILDMAREGLEFELGKLIRKAITRKKRFTSENIEVKYDGSVHRVDIEVKPITKPEQLRGLYMVVFKKLPGPEKLPKKTRKPKGSDAGRVAELEKELSSTKEYLQHVVEEQQTTNEELQSTNEELQASNEELQSTNEELETSKEEIQSVNEELVTVNSELQNKIDELAGSNNDLNNLLSSTDIAVIFLDNDLQVKRFTQAATRIVNLINADIGRPIEQISHILDGDEILSDVREVLDTLAFREKEVHTKKGEWYMMRIMPYRTTENVIDGVVITFFDTTRVKSAQQYAQSIVDTVREPLIVLDRDLRVVSANASFYSNFKVNRKETEKRLIYDLGNGQWDIPTLRKLLEEILPKSTEFNDFIVEHTFPQLGHRKMLLNARRMYEADMKTERILLAIEDITGR
jgi:two-component system CheB/CheR fusion protein